MFMTPEEGSTCVHPRPAHFFERLFCVCLDILSFFFLFFTRVHIFEQGVWKALPVQSLGCFSFMRALPSYLGGIYLINLTTQMLEFHHVYLTLAPCSAWALLQYQTCLACAALTVSPRAIAARHAQSLLSRFRRTSSVARI